MQRVRQDVEATSGVALWNAPECGVRVVIVGAGLAGLAAAQKLHAAGVSNVLVLDAQSRIGGRVHTVRHEQNVLELGAQWLHGAHDNPLYEWLANDLQMLDDFEDASLGFRGIYCIESTDDVSLSNGSEQISQELAKKVLDILFKSRLALSNDDNYMNQLLSKRNKSNIINNNNNNDDDHNYKFKIASDVFKCQLELCVEQDEELAANKSLVDALFEWFLRYETIENCCDNMNEVSVQSYTNWSDLGDGTLINFKNGYSSLLNWFQDQFPADKWIQLSTQVVGIELRNHTTSDCPLLVKCKSTSESSEQLRQNEPLTLIECDHVIVTSSIGFLKNNLDNSFFVPKLPETKRKLIESIGFGTVNKIVLQFEQPFWPDGGIKLVWRQHVGHLFPRWTRDILAFDGVRKQPNLLIGWIGGRGAKELESESDETVGQICVRLLRHFLPNNCPKPSKLIKCMCSRWHSNPFICGSYSFQSTQSLHLNVNKLHEPLYESECTGNNQQIASEFSSKLGNKQSNMRQPRVLFAGEATAGNLYSTTHGAILSGWREADRIVDYWKGVVSADSTPIHLIDEICPKLFECAN